MSTRTASITLGDAALTVTYDVRGSHLNATLIDPEEWPEIELQGLKTPGGEDVSGLLEFSPVYESALEKVTEREREDGYYQDDDAYDRYRDQQLESMV